MDLMNLFKQTFETLVEKMNKMPLFCYIDGLTYIEEHNNPIIKIYAVYPEEAPLYSRVNFQFEDSQINIKTFSINDFFTNKKYGVSFIFSNFTNLVAISDRISIKTLNNIFERYNLLDVITVSRDKAFDLSILLDKEDGPTDKAKRLAINCCKLFVVAALILENGELYEAYTQYLTTMAKMPAIDQILANIPLLSLEEMDDTQDASTKEKEQFAKLKQAIKNNIEQITQFIETQNILAHKLDTAHFS